MIHYLNIVGAVATTVLVCQVSDRGGQVFDRYLAQCLTRPANGDWREFVRA